MSQKVDLSLRSFFIFNSSLSKKECDEHKKILFYHSPSMDLDTKMKDIGLAEAIIKFTGNFTTEADDFKELYTQKSIQLFYQPEKDFWMIMIINAPCENKTTKDGNDIIEYKTDEVHNKIYGKILKQSYQMFKLFNGTFEMNLNCNLRDNAEEVEIFRKKLDLFYSKYVTKIKLTECDIIDAISSMQYLPLERSLFLRIYNFVNMIESTFPQIEHCIFLHNEQLIWSEIESTDLYSIHQYLIGSLFPKPITTELSSSELVCARNYDFSRYGTFLCGPENYDDSIKGPKVYLMINGALKEFHLVVYRALNASICIFINDKDTIIDEFYLELHSFMGSQLSSIATEIHEIYSKTTSITTTKPEEPKFLFLNQLTLQHQGTLYLGQNEGKTTLIPKNVMNLITDLYVNGNENGRFEEICLKTVNDYWIVKKTSNWRQFYVVIHNNKTTLINVTNEAKKLFDQHATNMFFEK